MPTRARTLANLFNDSIVPASNLAYDLGSSTNRFRDLYLSGSTLNLGGATMKTDDTTGTIALVAKPTASNPNPSALVVTSEGKTTAVATTGGTLNFTTVAQQIQTNPGFSGSYNDLTNKPTTTDITEGTNLYYTDTRARNAISVSGSGSYNSSTGVITVTGGVSSVNTLTGSVTLTTTNITEGTNLYYTDTRARSAISVSGSGSYNSSTGVITVTGGVSSVNTLTGSVTLTTTNITEGTNLYYTDTRARNAISIASGGSYNSSTGVITITGGGLAWQAVQASGFTAVAGRAYPCNTTSAAFTVTLPASAAAGDQITLADYAGTFGTNVLTINPNGLKIRGATTNQIVSTSNASVNLVYIDATKGWLVDSGITDNPFLLPPLTVDYLVVAGGGGGAAGGGGGGGGGFRTSTGLAVTAGTAYTVTVGAGGSSSAAGSNSVFSTITAAGGGLGGAGNTGSSAAAAGGSGGSGGGGGFPAAGGTASGGAGNTPTTTPSQGNSGGTGQHTPGSSVACGGGGGAGAAGSNASGGTSGAGGAGATSSITGSSLAYAGGGGGGRGTASSGGSGVGGGNPGDGQNGTAGTANRGGGGGGGGYSSSAGGSGGSGIVIIKISSVYTATFSAGLTTTVNTSAVPGFKIYSVTGGTGTVTFN